jgi:hypothetical protein
MDMSTIPDTAELFSVPDKQVKSLFRKKGCTLKTVLCVSLLYFTTLKKNILDQLN